MRYPVHSHLMFACNMWSQEGANKNSPIYKQRLGQVWGFQSNLHARALHEEGWREQPWEQLPATQNQWAMRAQILPKPNPGLKNRAHRHLFTLLTHILSSVVANRQK